LTRIIAACKNPALSESEAMKVLTDLTQRVSAGLAISEQHYETGIDTNRLWLAKIGFRWAMAAHREGKTGSLARTFNLSSAGRDRDWQRVEIIP
jgi:hypothetical protein